MSNKQIYAKHYSSLREIAREYRISDRLGDRSGNVSVAVWNFHKNVIAMATMHGDTCAAFILTCAYRSYFMKG
jgi:hypothetical protein